MTDTERIAAQRELDAAETMLTDLVHADASAEDRIIELFELWACMQRALAGLGAGGV